MHDMNIDPIELELMRNLFEAAAEEMGITLQRVAFSANIKERRDFSCAIFDAAANCSRRRRTFRCIWGRCRRFGARRCSSGSGGWTRAMSRSSTIRSPAGRICRTSRSSRRSCTTARIVGYAANRAHHADVGGISPGSMTLSRHIDEEGIRIEPALLYRRGGAVQDELLKRILDAVRTPDERLGDLDAQLAANRVGAAALRRMIERMGSTTVQRYGRALLDYSQSFMARTIDAIPTASMRFEDVLDDDGAGSVRSRSARSCASTAIARSSI